jgi:hypothetical protein
MRKVFVGVALVGAVGVLGVGSAATTAEAAPRRATLRIVAPAGMPFVTIGLSPPAFTGSRTFKNLKPGTYTVVQAPPIGGGVNLSCTNGGTETQVLLAGDDVTCTFSVTAG